MNKGRSKSHRRSQEFEQAFVHVVYFREEPSIFRVAILTESSLRRLGEWAEEYRFGLQVRKP